MGVSPQQFEQMQARLRRPPGRVENESSVSNGRTCRGPQVVLGIDPSLRGTGWGVLRVDRNGITAIGWGIIRCAAALPRTQCLVRIAAGLREAIRSHTPTTCAIEGLFFAQNLQTALLMGEARGVCLLAAAEAGLEVWEIAPRKVKQAIVGFGGAQKSAVARMVQQRLGLESIPPADAADALAIALAHDQSTNRVRVHAQSPL